MFKDKDVICFLGDSITANGLWMAEAYQELRKKYKIKCYNIGVPGGRIFMAEKCLYSRCLAFNPDYVTVSFGVNDVEHTYYADKYDGLTEDELKEKAFEIYNESYERVIKKIIDFGAQPIICIPSPYDNVNEKTVEKKDKMINATGILFTPANFSNAIGILCKIKKLKICSPNQSRIELETLIFINATVTSNAPRIAKTEW